MSVLAERDAGRGRGRGAGPVHRARVLRTEWLSPHLIRVVLGGELPEFRLGGYSDHYLKLLFPRPGVDYPEPLDIAEVRRLMPRECWPWVRTYTVRGWDAELRELTIDFVHHGEGGLGGPWAARARPGDELMFLGPGGAYVPDPTADWHLLVGDESALPAIAASVERLPVGAPAWIFVEVSGPDDEQKLAIGPEAELVWLHRAGRPVGEALVAAVRGFEFPAGRVHAFVHGEAGGVRELRRLLRVERGIPKENLSISGYWRRGSDEDGWQASKPEWNRRIEDEEARTLAAK